MGIIYIPDRGASGERKVGRYQRGRMKDFDEQLRGIVRLLITDGRNILTALRDLEDFMVRNPLPQIDFLSRYFAIALLRLLAWVV